MLGIVEVNHFPPFKKSNLQSASDCYIGNLLNESNISELGPEADHEAASIHTGSVHTDISVPISVPVPVPISLLGVSAITGDDASKRTCRSNVNSTEEVTDNAEQITVASEESVAPPEPMFR